MLLLYRKLITNFVARKIRSVKEAPVFILNKNEIN